MYKYSVNVSIDVVLHNRYSVDVNGTVFEYQYEWSLTVAVASAETVPDAP